MKRLSFTMLLIMLEFLQAQSKMNFEVDYAKFKYDSVSNFVEVYYLVDASVLTPKPDSSGFLSQAVLNFVIFNPVTKDTIAGNSYKYEKFYNDSTELRAPNQSQLGLLSYAVPLGKYTLEATIYDANNLKKWQKKTQEIIIENFESAYVKVSDIELAVNIKQMDEQQKSIFYKNSYEVLPNPSGLYTEMSPVLFYYSEIYNLKSLADTSYLITKSLFNSRNQKMTSQSKSVRSDVNSIVDVGLFQLKNYPTDKYYIMIEITDPVTRRISSSVRSFILYNPNVKDSVVAYNVSGTYMQSEFANMSEEECDLMFDQCKYIAVENETDEYESLRTEESKKEYMYNFWLKRDPNPGTMINELKSEYMQRVDFVNRNYGNFNSAGYKSDRGRIYLIYGVPDDIERYPNEKDKKPYEIWTYQSIEGGVYFVFADVRGISRYELMHSTKNGEMKDPEWERRIATE